MIYHGHLVHPEIWQLWAAVIMVPVNIAWLLCLSFQKKS